MKTTTADSKLLDCAAIARELGVSRKVADKLMAQLPHVEFPDIKKTYVKRDDLEKLVDSCTTLYARNVKVAAVAEIFGRRDAA